MTYNADAVTQRHRTRNQPTANRNSEEMILKMCVELLAHQHYPYMSLSVFKKCLTNTGD